MTSELDKYSKHDPLAQHSSRPKKSKLTVTDTDAWLKKHGNGMDRLKKNRKDKRGKYLVTIRQSQHRVAYLPPFKRAW